MVDGFVKDEPVIDALSEWAAGRAAEFEAVAQVRDADAPAAGRALELVRAFIVARGLVLYGGQAIDYALRLRGSRIYPDHQTPDFDFYSPRSVDDAYDLAEALRDAGFAGVGAIPAIHVQTMRVKTDFIFVADITYTPPEIFARLPTVSFAGMRVLHPDYQRADMHQAFCFPFNNPPREDVFNRFAKDLKRFRLLQEYYPIAGAAALCGPEPPSEAAGPRCGAKAAEDEPAVGGGGAPSTGKADAAAPAVPLARVALHGAAAYAVFRAAYAALEAAAAAAGVGAETLARARALMAHAPEASIEFAAVEEDGDAKDEFGHKPDPGADDGGEPLHRVGLAAPLIVASPWPDAVAARLARARGAAATTEQYAPYMDKRPQMTRVGGGRAAPVEVYSTKDSLLAVSMVDLPAAGGGAPVRVTVVCAQYLLMYALFEAHQGSAAAQKMYVATLGLLEAAGLLIAALRDEGPGPRVAPEVFRAFVESSPFGLSVRPFGDANHSEAYLIRRAGSARAVGEAPAEAPAPTPPKYFPAADSGKPSARPHFDYASSPAFQRRGQKL